MFLALFFLRLFHYVYVYMHVTCTCRGLILIHACIYIHINIYHIYLYESKVHLPQIGPCFFQKRIDDHLSSVLICSGVNHPFNTSAFSSLRCSIILVTLWTKTSCAHKVLGNQRRSVNFRREEHLNNYWNQCCI